MDGGRCSPLLTKVFVWWKSAKPRSVLLPSFSFLELESSGWRRELRLHYVHRSRTRTETFSSCDVITDGRWHRLAVNVIGAKHVTVFIDCELRFQRNIPEMDLRKIFAAAADDDEPQLRLWIGQRNARHVSFKVSAPPLRLPQQSSSSSSS